MSGGSPRCYPPERRERAVRMVAEISDQHQFTAGDAAVPDLRHGCSADVHLVCSCAIVSVYSPGSILRHVEVTSGCRDAGELPGRA
jgi:hypothetical protein